jgi:glycine/D-amino acid oxidase-like deaminating enzyme
MKNSSLKVAIIGGGFAGLSITWHLASSGIPCTLFDEKGIGQGASGIASGLLHPFPGAATHYSFMGQEAMHHSLKLLKIAQSYSKEKVADFSGILKLALDNEDKRNYSALTERYERLKWLETDHLKKEVNFINPCPSLLVENGVTVFCEKYLKSLWLACQDKKAQLSLEEIRHISDLDEYDIKIICSGRSIGTFDKTLKLQFIKGQILTCKAPYPLTSKSIIAKGYIAITSDPLIYHFGSTYEHHYKEEGPCVEIAKKLIFEHCSSYTDIAKHLEVLECKAGVRVSNSKTHLPIIKRYSRGEYAITALGSRGLLYHGLIGKQLAECILSGEEQRISREFFLS